MLVACSTLEPPATAALETAGFPDACAPAPAATIAGDAEALDATRIRLLSWNIAKAARAGWEADYETLAGQRNLVLVQEAPIETGAVPRSSHVPHWSFAPGFRTRETITGVLTLSSVAPIQRCHFSATEPLMRTPKATGITRFALRGSAETLLVVNVHAVNFSLGLKTFRQQFERIGAVIAGHAGPVILSGDFNTWRPKRQLIVDALARRYDLVPVHYEVDLRRRVLGHPLDHVYVRGLTPRVATTEDVKTSDHNPISVTLQVAEAAVGGAGAL